MGERGNPASDARVRSDVTTVLSRLERSAGSSAALTFVGSAAGGEPDVVPWGRLHEDAQATAAALQARGVAPGDHVGVLGATSRPLVTAIEAVWLAGATLVCLPLPLRLGSVEEFVAQTRERIRHADIRLVIVDAELAAFLHAEPGDPPVVTLDVLGGDARRWERPPDDPGALALLQFTSGSTADPKGVMLPHENLVHNIDAIVEAAGLTNEDRGVSWLPLYHDMGLIGLLMTPMLIGFDLVLAAPTDFLAAPGDWLRWMSEYRGTVTCAPNFGYALAARALRRLDGLDLSSWRLGLNGAEPIDPDAVDRFLAAGAPHGLDPRSALCVYGMAEATLAISFPEPGHGMAVDEVDRDALERQRYADPAPGRPSTRLARLGRPLRGLDVRVCDPGTGAARAASARSVSSRCGARPSRPATTGGPRSAQPVVTTTGCAPATSGTSSTARWSSAGASRTSSSSGVATSSPRRSSGPRPASMGSGPATSSPSGCPAGGARRGSSSSPRPVSTTRTRSTMPWWTGSATPWASRRSRWCWCRPAACPRPRRASCSGPAAGTSTSTTALAPA